MHPQSGNGARDNYQRARYTANRIVINDKDAPQTEYSCSGTPVDCVKIAVNEVARQKTRHVRKWSKPRE